MEIDSISFTLGFFLAVFSQAAITLRGYEFFPLPLCFLPRCPRLFSLSLSLYLSIFFSSFRARDAQFRAHTHTPIHRTCTIVRSIHFFLLSPRIRCLFSDRVHSSFEVEIGSTFVFIHDSFLVRSFRGTLSSPIVFFIPPFIHPFATPR